MYPSRAAAVEAWLRTRPEPDAGGCAPLHEKAFAWSHMAGWYAVRECDDFYQNLWRLDDVAAALTSRLKAALMSMERGSRSA